jgi:hypothetical protein
MMKLELPYIYVLDRQTNPAKSVFGYRLPHLPDFLSDHSLLGQSDQGRVAEILSRWTQFIVGLRKWRGSAFSLRYLADPLAGSVETALVGRLTLPSGQNISPARGMAAEMRAQLAAFGFAGEPLTEEGLRRMLLPFNTPPAIVEVRQHEEVTPLLVLNSDAYVVHPFWAPTGSWLLPFETMLQQSASTAVNLYLEPTTLSPAEHEGLLKAAQIAHTFSDQSRRTYSQNSIQRWRDPQAELVGRIYSELVKQLREPYLLVVQVASTDPSAAWTVARSLGAAITAGNLEQITESDERNLPTGFDIHMPSHEREMACARRSFARVSLHSWGTGLASDDKQRLTYLVGAKGAAAAFRFPISVRGGVPGIAVRQTAPDFEPGPRPAGANADELLIGRFRRGGAATVKLRHLTRHALITGFTGAGKTNTVLHLLKQLWAKRKAMGLRPIPFLVIEAAKKEYRGLLDQPEFEDLLVFTLGDETTSPFRLNPFELLEGVRLEAHLGKLQTCFDAALPQFGILPSIVAESLELIYQEKGWRGIDRGPTKVDSTRLFPTMRDMFAKVIQVAETRGYAGETYHNIRAAAAGRIGSLLRGSKGRMFSTQRSVPLGLLMERPVILELNDLNQQDKALTMMFLLMLLREYREMHRAENLQHVTVIEEAHNVMENVQSVGASEIAADTRAKAVEAFAAMLAEVRAYGEGIIISDQSPEKLAPDAVRNTNLQIAHQLRHRDDRDAMAAAMIMDDTQKEYLAKLRVGEAAIFLTGYDRATFVRVPNYKDEVGFREFSDSAVEEHMEEFREHYVQAYLPFDGCRFCGSPCSYREAIEPYSLNKELAEQFQDALRRFEEHPEPDYWTENWREVARVCTSVARQAGYKEVLLPAWCYLAHEIDFPFTSHMQVEFNRAVESLGG